MSMRRPVAAMSPNGPVWVAGEKGCALGFNGTTQSVANQACLFPGTTNSFTMALWAKPAAARQSVAETNRGANASGVQRYAIQPEYGHGYGGQDHAGAGISIGTNGVSVYEHGYSHNPALLVHDMELAGWNHVAVVYEAKQPKLYVNGVLVKTGQSSTRTVHPSASLGEGGPNSYDGLLSDVRIYNRALTADELEQLVRNTK